MMELTVPPSEEGEAEVIGWMAHDGDEVSEGQAVVELAYDKLELEVTAPTNGILRDLRVTQGEIVEPGQVLATIEELDASR